MLLTVLAIAAIGQLKPAVLNPSSYQTYVERFNREDRTEKDTPTQIPNKDAGEFLAKNVPLFDCPDKQFEELYYFRWWSFRKHLTKTPAGWVITEFLPPVPWASQYNTISCAAGHHLYEARWIRDQQFAEDYARFWSLPEASPRNYSFWYADSVRAVTAATGDRRLAWDLLPNLAANYRAWERSHLDPGGLFTQSDDRDGMEYSLGGSGLRPSINSYMYGDAHAISELAALLNDHPLKEEFGTKAARLKQLVQERLWNPTDGFFETLGPKKVREQIGFTPWYFNLPDARFNSAWDQLTDPHGFAAEFGLTTAERRATGFMHPEDHDCLWNGPSWPYATTQTLVALANLLNGEPPKGINAGTYFHLISSYARSQWKDGRPWVAEDLDADTGKWIVDLPRSIYYNHSGFADLVITGLVGLRPRLDDRIELRPLVPSSEWKWFCLDNIPYHGQNLTVLWDADGSHYGKGAGLTLFINGKLVANRKDLGPLNAVLPHHAVTPMPDRWQKYAGGPVLGGKLGTCFDVCMLEEEDGRFKMYFSWRPKKSVAVVESPAGIHGSDPEILIGPAATGWEDDINRPSVVKRDGVYHMWYTGQFDGKSAIGYATSADGHHWTRQARPVLEADRPWEKVAVMCPSVLWDASAHEFRMWYSGGEQYEPDAIGYATSPDGQRWTKHDQPVFEADPHNRWEQYKVTACQVLHIDGWYTMFYIGFRDIDHAQIGIARSRDGIAGWERLKNNPIISPTVDGWDADACYKPFALFDAAKKQWMLWYNGRHGGLEQIGLATKRGRGLGF